jgi:hypothetical protein
MVEGPLFAIPNICKKANESFVVRTEESSQFTNGASERGHGEFLIGSIEFEYLVFESGFEALS